MTILAALTAPAVVYGETVSFCAVPTVLPRDTAFASYSPRLCIGYGGLTNQVYTLRIHLLETQSGNFFCASDQWCPVTWRIDNTAGNQMNGQKSFVQPFEVQGYSSFLWVADLLVATGNVVATATQSASATTNRAPALANRGGISVGLGQQIDVVWSAVDAEGDSYTFTAVDLPAGATFHSTTGRFQWTPGATGTYSPILSVMQTAAPTLSDSEQVQIRVTDLAPASVGAFGPVVALPTVPIHMHLMPNGKVLFWDRHSHEEGWDGTPYQLDVASGVSEAVPAPGFDVFCSGHTFLADGRLFVAGGHIDDNVGEPRAAIFDSVQNKWMQLPNMRAGRWYPTCSIMPDGSVFVEAGTVSAETELNLVPEVWSGAWRQLSGVALLHDDFPDWADYYPFAFATGGTDVFIAGPQRQSRTISISGAGSVTNVAASGLNYRDYGSGVMYDGKRVLVVGGNPRDDNMPAIFEPSRTAEVIDLSEAVPHWRRVNDMSIGRRQLTATLLPDGTVLVSGGSSAPGFDTAAGAVRYLELWDPATEQWTQLAKHVNYRGYHSVALLLVDGRVIVGGGGHPSQGGEPSHPDIDIFSPPYLFRGNRPVIASAPTIVRYGDPVVIETPSNDVGAVNLIRLGSVTHGFNESQRICRLGSPMQFAGGIAVAGPSSADACVPGPYLLFLLSSTGVPSVASFVQVGETVASPTRTPTPTLTGTRTHTATAVPTASAIPTSTFTPTRTPTPSATDTRTPTPTLTATRMHTATALPTASEAPTRTSTASTTAGQESTPTQTYAMTVTETASSTPSATRTHEGHSTVTPIPTSPSPTSPGTPFVSPSYSATSVPTATPPTPRTPTVTHAATSASPATATSTPAFSPSHTPIPIQTTTPSVGPPTPLATSTPVSPLTDANCDGVVSAADISAIVARFEVGRFAPCASDVNRDGTVDNDDVRVAIDVLFGDSMHKLQPR